MYLKWYIIKNIRQWYWHLLISWVPFWIIFVLSLNALATWLEVVNHVKINHFIFEVGVHFWTKYRRSDSMSIKIPGLTFVLNLVPPRLHFGPWPRRPQTGWRWSGLVMLESVVWSSEQGSWSVPRILLLTVLHLPFHSLPHHGHSQTGDVVAWSWEWQFRFYVWLCCIFSSTWTSGRRWSIRGRRYHYRCKHQSPECLWRPTECYFFACLISCFFWVI